MPRAAYAGTHCVPMPGSGAAIHRTEDCAKEGSGDSELPNSGAQIGGRKTLGFDEEIRVAMWAWQHARQPYVQHVLDHECSSAKDLI
jgi:hypothetical protein